MSPCDLSTSTYVVFYWILLSCLALFLSCYDIYLIGIGQNFQLSSNFLLYKVLVVTLTFLMVLQSRSGVFESFITCKTNFLFITIKILDECLLLNKYLTNIRFLSVETQLVVSTNLYCIDSLRRSFSKIIIPVYKSIAMCLFFHSDPFP